MSCVECENATSKGHKGTRNANCVDCCARAVISARPHKGHQENMIDALDRFKGSPGREMILERVKKLRENG